MNGFMLLALLALPPDVEQIVVIVADDVGVDRIGAYAEHPRPGRTPNIDRLAARGMLFRNAWAYPLCTPTRAALMTGRLGFRTGIGTIVRPPFSTGPFNSGLPPDETSIADVLRPRFRTIMAGKWHLADHTQGLNHPAELGFDTYGGSYYNLGWDLFGGNYFTWNKTVDGRQSVQTGYVTTDTADDAVDALTHDAPIFLVASFNAAHAPLHAPPPWLHGFDLAGDPDDTPVLHTKAIIEAMDTEIGRILDAVSPRATVFFLGDNGTHEDSTDYPFDPDHSKSSLYEGGVNVPLIVAGPSVASGECRAIVQVTDLFATIAEIAGVTSDAEDSVSLVPYFQDPDRPPLRRHVYAERFRPNGPGPYQGWRQAIRDARYKLIRRKHTPDELYDLAHDRFEQENLLDGPLTHEQRRAYLRLVENLPHRF